MFWWDMVFWTSSSSSSSVLVQVEGQCPRSSFVTSILIVVVVVVIFFVFGTGGITDTSWLIRVALVFVEYC